MQADRYCISNLHLIPECDHILFCILTDLVSHNHFLSMLFVGVYMRIHVLRVQHFLISARTGQKCRQYTSSKIKTHFKAYTKTSKKSLRGVQGHEEIKWDETSVVF